MRQNVVAVVPRSAPGANAIARAAPATYSQPGVSGANGNTNASATATSDTGYGPPGVIGTGAGSRGSPAAIPVSSDYSPPGDIGPSVGSGPWGGFAVDTGGIEPPILTPNGPVK